MHQLKLSAVAAAIVLATVGFAGCSDDSGITATVIPVSGAGNGLFVNVKMTATCANGPTGTGIIGATIPGEGTIYVYEACTFPVLIEATGAGQMRPIGAKADGSQDVVYDPAVNLPISNIFETPPSAGVTANPVTTLVVNALAPTGTALSTVDATKIDAAQKKIETSLGLAIGDGNKSYLQPLVAEASSKIVAVAALAAVQASKAGVKPSGVTASKSLGRVIAEQIANTAKNGTPMPKALDIANAINLGANRIDVTGNAAVTGNEINNDATTVFNMVYTALDKANKAGTPMPANANELIKAIAADTTLAASITAHIAEAKKTEAQNKASKAVADALAAGTSSALTTATTAAADQVAAANTSGTTVTTENTRVSTTTTTAATTTTTTAATTSTTAAATTTTAAPTTTTAAATTTTKAPTTTTAAATTTTAAATTTTTKAPTTTTAAATTTTAAATTTTTTATTTTTTQAPTGTPLNLATTPPTPFDSKSAVGINDASGAANYTGAPLQFGPYTIGGLSAATNVTLPPNAGLQNFTTFSINGGAFGATGAVNSGDTISVKFDLTSYITNFNGGPVAYSATLSPKIKAGTPIVAFSILMCGDPTVPPGVGNSVCK